MPVMSEGVSGESVSGGSAAVLNAGGPGRLPVDRAAADGSVACRVRSADVLPGVTGRPAPAPVEPEWAGAAV
jgi:hypothetical protein